MTSSDAISPAEVISTAHQLPAALCPQPHRLVPTANAFPMRINGYFLSLLQRPDDPLARQVIPDPAELADHRSKADPLGEETQSPAPLIIHRYPGRVIFLVSHRCAVHCRFCMRKRKVGHNEPPDPRALDQGLAYIRATTGISEVILSGGDPLMLSDAALMEILTALRNIAHVRVLRIHTRIPCVWPQRVTPELANALSRFHPLYINIHFNHPDEITRDVALACNRLADAGLPLGSQTVLLRGINDDAAVLRDLMERLLTIRVRPYYLHQVDRVPGTAHFQVPVDEGLQIMERLRGRLTGMAMPHFMVDLPDGGGKIELLPKSIIRKSTSHWLIRDMNGQPVRYPLD